MATATRNNVFSLAPAQARRHTIKPESVGVINDCRDLALKRIVGMLSKTFDSIENELFEMAEKAPDRDAQSLYLDARAQAREKRSDIEASFRKQFLSFFERKVTGASNDEVLQSTDAFNFESMTLVEDDALEQHLAMNAIANRLNSKCDWELRALSQRMGFLLSDPELKDDANPMAPDTIVRALQVACNQMTSGFQAKLTVMRLVEQHIASEMLDVYRDINTHLVSRNIMPELRPSFRKAPTIDARKPSTTVPVTKSNIGTVAEHVAGATKFSSPPVDLFTTLQQLMSGGTIVDPGLNATHFAGLVERAPPVPSDHAPASEPGISGTRAGLVAALTGMQQQLAPEPATMTPVAHNAQNFACGETSLAALNVLHAIKSLGMTSASSQVDTMTIDIVAMLFDYVFEDKFVPDAIKALISRLQIPVLKVAIIDRSFFSLKSHPARRLMDALADASVCFGGQTTRDDPLYKQMELTVDRIHSEFDTDISLFSIALADFEEFLKGRELASVDLIEKSARAVHDSEKREMARLVSVDEIERRASVDLPAVVSAMLRGPWARVLERVYLRGNGRDLQFGNALQTADDLIWSVSPKLNAEERKGLVDLLPALLRRLQEGMSIAAVDEQDRRRFFSALIDCHAAAVKAGLRGESVSSVLSATKPAAEMAPLFEKLFVEESARVVSRDPANRSGIARILFTDRGVEIEEIASRETGMAGPAIVSPIVFPPAPSIPEKNDSDAMAIPVPDLKRGTWVEFLQEGRNRIRAKLTWVSPLKGMYLFTNPGEREALSVAPDVLHRQFEMGDARIIEASSIIDRAVDHMVKSLANALA